MAPAVGRRMAEPAAVDRSTLADEQLAELCRLLVGVDRERLAATLQQVDDRRRLVELLGGALDDAVRNSARRGPELSRALAPIIAAGVHETVHRDASAFGKALAPAMGPAIRQAVLQMFRNLVETFERTLDHSLSPRAWRWRLEAWRTGVSFAQVVFLKTLAFRVEHVFLIHGESGLLLQHAYRPDARHRDPELVSAMLTAIQDFVGDALDARKGDRLGAFEVGELTVWVENATHAVLAAVIRGQPGRAVRDDLKRQLERIELAFDRDLEAFRGDCAPFDAALPLLDECLVEQRIAQNEAAPAGVSWLVKAGLVAGLLSVLAGIGWWAYASQQASRRLAALVARVEAEPGFVLARAERHHGRYRLVGLRDPDARPAAQVVRDAGVDPDSVDGSWEPYHALHSDLVVRRARRVLGLPERVAAVFVGGVLQLSGVVEPELLARLVRREVTITGVERLDLGGLYGFAHTARLRGTPSAGLEVLAIEPDASTPTCFTLVLRGQESPLSGRRVAVERVARSAGNVLEIDLAVAGQTGNGEVRVPIGALAVGDHAVRVRTHAAGTDRLFTLSIDGR